MIRFGRRREDHLERLLRENRPEPRNEFLAPMVERAASGRSRPRLGGVGRRVALAAAVTVAAAGTAVAAGAVSSASNGLGHLVGAAHHTFSQPSQQASIESQGSDDADNDQYRVTICHFTGKKNQPYVEITVSPQGAAEHKAHHPNDIVPAPPGGCPGGSHNNK
jgi:hypothetical protein